MALGTATVNVSAGESSKPLFFEHLSFAGDGAYPDGGTAAFEAYVQAAIGTAKGSVDLLAIVADDCGGYVPVYDRANDKLKVYYADYDAVADGALIEVPDTTNLSGTTFNLLAICA